MNDHIETDQAQADHAQTEQRSASTRFTCRHLNATGLRCGSPALRGQHFCYFHNNTRRPTPRPNGNRYPNEDKEPFVLPVVEDRRSIQLALSQVLSRIAANDLDPKRAGLLLYGLQIAVCALPPEPRPSTRADERHEEQEMMDDPNDPTSPNHVPEAVIDELIVDPIHGPLAPIAEFTPPAAKARPLSCVEQILERIANRPVDCLVCHPTPPPEPAPYPFTLPTIQAVAEAHSSTSAIPPPLPPTLPSFRAQPGISVSPARTTPTAPCPIHRHPRG